MQAHTTSTTETATDAPVDEHVPIAASHEVTVTRTDHERDEVPRALHLRCECGWTASAHDEALARQLVADHRADGVIAPVPSTPSPD